MSIPLLYIYNSNNNTPAGGGSGYNGTYQLTACIYMYPRRQSPAVRRQGGQSPVPSQARAPNQGKPTTCRTLRHKTENTHAGSGHTSPQSNVTEHILRKLSESYGSVTHMDSSVEGFLLCHRLHNDFICKCERRKCGILGPWSSRSSEVLPVSETLLAPDCSADQRGR